MSTKTCNISETAQHIEQGYYDGLTARKSYIRFQLIAKINDLEWPKRTLAEKKRFTGPTRKKIE